MSIKKGLINVYAILSICLLGIVFNINIFNKNNVFVYAVESSFSGDGTETSPNQISNFNQLVELSNLINSDYYVDYANKHYILTSNIYFNTNDWTPIGAYYDDNGSQNTNYKFTGVFDGQSHSIIFDNVSINYNSENPIYYGIFGYCDGANISNITMSGSATIITEGNTVSLGAIAGYANSSSINNCTNNINLKGVTTISSVNSMVGGIVGQLVSSTISSCVNYGNVEAVSTRNAQAGGIVGFAPNANSNLYKCINFGTIKANSAVFNMAAGMAGQSYGTIEECLNFGDCLCQGQWLYPAGMTGQLVGGTIKNCHNAGDMTGISQVSGGSVSAGGLVGQVYQSGRMLKQTLLS